MSDFDDFFEKVKDAVVKGATTVADKSEQIVELGKHKVAVLRLESQRGDQLKELGLLFYEMFTANTLQIEALRAKCDSVAEIDKQIAEHKAEEERLKSEGKEPPVQGN